MVAKLRLYSGLILLFFVIAHLINKISGLHSFEAMDASSIWTTHPWRTMVGKLLLVGAILTHNGLSLWSLYRRETLKMKGWEATQNIFGLLIPIFLSAHIVGTKLAHEVMGQMNSYAFEMVLFFKVSPESGISQALLVILVWIHGCIGLHTWLRLKPRYLRFQNIAISIAVIFPTLALAGYFAAGMRALAMIEQNPAWYQEILTKAKFGPEITPWVVSVYGNVLVGYAVVLTVLFTARWIRLAMVPPCWKSCEPTTFRTRLCVGAGGVAPPVG